MINEDTVNALLKWRTFKTNMHLVSNSLGLSDKDATQELLNSLINHRFKKYTASELNKLVMEHDVNLGWSITYERLSLISSYYKQLGKRAEMEHSAKLEDVSTGVIKLADDNGDKVEDISEFKLQQVVSLFPTDKTRLFVDLTLRYGKTETMAVLKLTNKQYARRLRNATSYVNRHRSKFDLVTDQTRDRQLYILNSLNELFSIIDKEGSIQDWIDGHIKLVNELLADSEVRYQGTIIRAFNQASRLDQYAFIRKCISQQQLSQQWLTQSNEMIKQLGEKACD